MRILGFTLLIVGFAAMNWKIMQARDIQYGAASDQMQRMSQQESYARKDVMIGMVRVASDVWDHTTLTFYFSGVAMLAGGLLTAFGPKRQRHETHTAQPSAGGNAAPPRASA